MAFVRKSRSAPESVTRFVAQAKSDARRRLVAQLDAWDHRGAGRVETEPAVR